VADPEISQDPGRSDHKFYRSSDHIKKNKRSTLTAQGSSSRSRSMHVMFAAATAFSPEPDASLSPTRTGFSSSLPAFTSDLPSRRFSNERKIENPKEDYTHSRNLPKKIDSIRGTNLPQCLTFRRRARKPLAGSWPETAYAASSSYEKAAFRRQGR
jgi:hypothetical protein